MQLNNTVFTFYEGCLKPVKIRGNYAVLPSGEEYSQHREWILCFMHNNRTNDN